MNPLFFILAVIGTLFALTAFLIVKDSLTLVKSFEDLFFRFIQAGKNDTDSETELTLFLLTGLRKTVGSKYAYLFTFQEDIVKERFESFDEKMKGWSDYLFDTVKCRLTEPQLDSIRSGKLTPELSMILFKNDRIRNKSIDRYSMVYPVYQQEGLDSMFVFLFEKKWHFLRGRRLIFVHDRKLARIVMNFIVFIRGRSENAQMNVLDNIRDYSFITVDKNFRIISWNKGSVLMFGYEFNEAVDKDVRELFLPQSLEAFEKAVSMTHLKEETLFKAEMKDRSNIPIFCEVLVKTVGFEASNTGFHFLIKDVSKEEVLKQNIKNKTMINRSIVENTRDGIAILNQEDRIVFINERFKNITDTNVAFLGMNIADVFDRKNGVKIKTRLKELRTSKIDFTFLDIRAGSLWFNVRFFSTKDESGRYDGAILFLVDNTLRMKDKEEIEHKNKLFEEMNKRLISDIHAGRMLQMSLVPKILPNDRKIVFESIYMLSQQLGGDFYYAEDIRLGRKQFYIAMISDVSGHGISSSMLSVFVKEIYNEFKNTAEFENDLKASRLLNMLNKRIFELDIETNLFITAFCYIVDIDRGTVYFSSAGHPHMALIQKNGNIRFCGIEKSPPVGVIEKYRYNDDIQEIKKGDRLLLYTDGLLDVFASQESYYSYFNNFLMENRLLDIDDFKKKIEKKISEIEKNSKENDNSMDDLTALIAKIK